MRDTPYSQDDIFQWLSATFFLWFILAIYLDNVLPNVNGVGKSWFYFLKTSYWTGKASNQVEGSGCCSCRGSADSVPPSNGSSPDYEDVATEESLVTLQVTENKMDPNVVVQVRGLIKTFPGIRSMVGCCKCRKRPAHHAVKIWKVPSLDLEMASEGVVTVYGNGRITDAKKYSYAVKVGLAQILRGGVIMDVVNGKQARIAEEAGVAAVMALERVPADTRAQGEVAQMSDPGFIKEIKCDVTIPVMAKNLGESLRRIAEGAAMIRTKGEDGTSNVIEAVRHVRSVLGDIWKLQSLDADKVFTFAKQIVAPYELVRQTKQLGRLPVVNFAANQTVHGGLNEGLLMVQAILDASRNGVRAFADSVASLRRSMGLALSLLESGYCRMSSLSISAQGQLHMPSELGLHSFIHHSPCLLSSVFHSNCFVPSFPLLCSIPVLPCKPNSSHVSHLVMLHILLISHIFLFPFPSPVCS